VGISPGTIEVNGLLEPGGRYNLPPVGVTNTGDLEQNYRVAIRHYEDEGTQRVPPAWIQIEPRTFHLAPGEHQSIDLSITLPGGAEPGEYLTLVEAQMGSGQAIQGGVATVLSFSVDESSWLESLRRQVTRWLEDASPWVYLVPALIVAGSVVSWSSKRVRFRLPFEPR
jgi:hypothetical protein